MYPFWLHRSPKKDIELRFYWQIVGVIIIFDLILHIILVILSVLNAKATDKKVSRWCWIICAVLGLVLGVNDIMQM